MTEWLQDEERSGNRDSRCVGCGYCCKTVICRTGAMFYGHYKSSCPALEWNGVRYVCRLFLSDPIRYESSLDIGGGCCFPSNPMRVPV
ncbi:MAG: hypothetical protein AB1646_11885 [Thermodesulfobacteriota bacterium]